MWSHNYTEQGSRTTQRKVHTISKGWGPSNPKPRACCGEQWGQHWSWRNDIRVYNPLSVPRRGANNWGWGPLKMMRSQPTTLGCKQIWMLYQEGGSPIKTFPRTGTYVASTDKAPVDTDWKDTTAQRNTQLLARNLWSMAIEDQMDARWARPATNFTPRCVKLHSEKENASMLTAN